LTKYINFEQKQLVSNMQIFGKQLNSSDSFLAGFASITTNESYHTIASKTHSYKRRVGIKKLL